MFLCIFFIKGRWNVWNPWYLILEDNPGKVDCKFRNNVILYCKDRMLFHLGYWCDGNGWTRVVVCSTSHPWVKTLFARCGGLVPPLLKVMEIPRCISKGWIESVVMETLNLLMEREFTLTSQMEGVRTFTPLTNSTKGPSRSTNNNTRTFWQVSLPKGLNSTKK